MTDTELLEKVKIALFGSSAGAWRDEMLMIYINEVKAFMIDAGVSESVIESSVSVGCIAIGVNDLWNYAAGEAKFSDYFYKRVKQLTRVGGVTDETA